VTGQHGEQGGLAILFITHDLSLGNYVSDRTVILRRGAIVEMGDTVKVFSNPQHPYTRDLLAAVPELRKKWHPAAGETRAFPADGASGPTLEPPLLTRFEEDHFVAAAES